MFNEPRIHIAAVLSSLAFCVGGTACTADSPAASGSGSGELNSVRYLGVDGLTLVGSEVVVRLHQNHPDRVEILASAGDGTNYWQLHGFVSPDNWGASQEFVLPIAPGYPAIGEASSTLRVGADSEQSYASGGTITFRVDGQGMEGTVAADTSGHSGSFVGSIYRECLMFEEGSDTSMVEVAIGNNAFCYPLTR